MGVRLAVLAAVVAVLALAACGDGADEPANAPAAPREFFGVVPQAELFEDDLDRMAEGNVGTLRLVVPWSLADPTPKADDLNFTFIDSIIAWAAAREIQVLPTVYGTPDWVAEGIDGADCSPACANVAPQSKKAIDAFRDFVGALVERYGPNGVIWNLVPADQALPIRAWQIWNEQNSPTFYQPEVDAKAYAELLEEAAAEIQAADPEAEVILGGMFGTPFQGKPPGQTAWEYLRELYELGAADSFDSAAAHPYAAHQGKVEQQVERMHAEIERAGDDAGIWITEMGLSSDEGGNPLERGLEGQAAALTASFEYFLAQREAFDIRGVTWYAWRDIADENQCAWCAGSGLFEEASLTPKPSWEAFVSFTGGS